MLYVYFSNKYIKKFLSYDEKYAISPYAQYVRNLTLYAYILLHNLSITVKFQNCKNIILLIYSI